MRAVLGGGCDGASVYDEALVGSDLGAFTIVRNLKSIPWDAYCAHGDLDPNVIERLRSALLQLEVGSPLAEDILGESGLNFSGFSPSDDSLYDSVRELL